MSREGILAFASRLRIGSAVSLQVIRSTDGAEESIQGTVNRITAQNFSLVFDGDDGKPEELTFPGDDGDIASANIIGDILHLVYTV